MICIKCRYKKTAITNSRYFERKHQTWRRRKCLSCHFTFTTYESVSLDQLKVEGKAFEEVRLLLSIGRCLEHLTETRINATQGLTKTIIEKILRSNTSSSLELTKKDIAEIAYQSLHHYDRIASVQYAARHSRFLKNYLK